MNNLPLDVKCHKVLYVGNLFCANETSTYSIKYMVWNKRYWKGHITKPLFFNLIVQNETYTCIFCNSWFFEFRCGVRIFTIIGHMSSPRYSHLVVHVGLHNHPSAKGENWKALNKMDQSIETYLEENLNTSSKAISCKLVQWEFLHLLVKKDLITKSDILQGDMLLEVLKNVTLLANKNKVKHKKYRNNCSMGNTMMP